MIDFSIVPLNVAEFELIDLLSPVFDVWDFICPSIGVKFYRIPYYTDIADL